MTGAELKTIRESLYLSAKELATRLGLRSDRTIRHWEAEDDYYVIPEGVAATVLAWDKSVEDAVSRGLEEHKDATEVTFYRPEHGPFPGDELPNSRRLRYAYLARLRRCLEARGIKVTIKHAPSQPEE